jgi:ADP-ribosylation factor 2-binding protein
MSRFLINPKMESEEIKEEIIVEDDQMDIESEDEFEITAFGQSAEEDLFDTIVGRLEDIVMSYEFNIIQERFVRTYCSEFTDEEENKLIYMEIFQKYQIEIEKYIEKKLYGVDMNQFTGSLMQRQNEIDGPLFEMLLSFSDFHVFKELMLSYNFVNDLEIEGTASIIHSDKNHDGNGIQDFHEMIFTNDKRK